jgi:hypothetical protein
MRRSGLLAIAAAIAIAIAISMAGADKANAYPKKVCTAGKCKTVCRQKLADGWTVDYDEGTTITVSSPDGKTKNSFTCRNGNWVKTRNVPGGKPVDPLNRR